MIRQLTCLSGLLAAVASTQALAAPPAAVAATTEAAAKPAPPAKLAMASDVIRLTTPGPLLQEAVKMGWDVGMKEEAASFAEMDAAVPGLSKALAERGRIELTAMVVERLPGLQRELATLLASGTSEEELAKMAEFYRSTTGQKVIREMILSPAGMDMGEDSDFSSTEISKATKSAALDAIGKLSPDEKVELIRFSVSPAGLASKRAATKRDALMAEWMNRLMKDFETRIEPIIVELIQKSLPEKTQ